MKPPLMFAFEPQTAASGSGFAASSESDPGAGIPSRRQTNHATQKTERESSKLDNDANLSLSMGNGATSKDMTEATVLLELDATRITESMSPTMESSDVDVPTTVRYMEDDGMEAGNGITSEYSENITVVSGNTGEVEAVDFDGISTLELDPATTTSSLPSDVSTSQDESEVETTDSGDVIEVTESLATTTSSADLEVSRADTLTAEVTDQTITTVIPEEDYLHTTVAEVIDISVGDIENENRNNEGNHTTLLKQGVRAPVQNVTSTSVSNTGTRNGELLLEASPTIAEIHLDPTKVPSDNNNNITDFDLKISTMRKDLQVDVHDAAFDPSQIAKATSYQGSSYSTATRSATVTTWVDPNDRNMTANNTVEVTSLLKPIQKLNNAGFENLNSSFVTRSNVPITVTTESFEEISTLSVKDEQPADTLFSKKLNVTRVDTHHTLHHTESVSNGTHSKLGNDSFIPVIVGEYEMQNKTATSVLKKVNESETEAPFVYELPLPESPGNSGAYMNTSMLIALSVCCSVVFILSVMTLTLWLCRRHRNRSKVYLSREAAKPRAFFTKPMNPALLPHENMTNESFCMAEFQRPRPPIMLSDDQTHIAQSVTESSQAEGSLSIGIDNDGFTDIPLTEAKCGSDEIKKPGHDPPKYNSKNLYESDGDSGIRLWSSTGSLYTASPQLRHCSVPPPPYMPSIGKDSMSFSVHGIPSISKRVEEIINV